MHWRKPFPPRSLHPSPIAEFRALIQMSFQPEAGKDASLVEKPVEVRETSPVARAVTHGIS